MRCVNKNGVKDDSKELSLTNWKKMGLHFIEMGSIVRKEGLGEEIRNLVLDMKILKCYQQFNRRYLAGSWLY